MFWLNRTSLVLSFTNHVWFVAGSVFASLRLVRAVIKASVTRIKSGIPILVLLSTLGTVNLWMNPQVFGTGINIKEELTQNTQSALVPLQTDDNAVEQIQKQGFFAQLLALIQDFFSRALPDLRMVFLLGPLFLLLTALGGAYTGYLRVQRSVRTPYTRKIFHFYIFSIAGLTHLAFGLKAVVLLGIIVSLCVLYAVCRGNGFPFYEAMARPTDLPHRTFFILVPLLTTALGGGISNLVFGKFAYIGYFVAGWGDAVGEPVGTKWGKHKYRVPSLLGVKATRSVEGSFSVFFTGAFVAFFALVAAGYPPLKAGYAAVACGLVGAVVEAFSSHGLDNLTIQVAATATAYFLLK